MITTMAFSNAFLVMISEGLIFFSIRFLIALPAARHSFFFSSLNAGFDDEYGKLIPSASIAEDMVLAVYIPPHAPALGQDCFTMFLKSSADKLPAIFCPSASKAEIILRSCPW